MPEAFILTGQPIPVPLYRCKQPMLRMTKWVMREVGQGFTQICFTLAVNVDMGYPIIFWIKLIRAFIFLVRHGDSPLFFQYIDQARTIAKNKARSAGLGLDTIQVSTSGTWIV